MRVFDECGSASHQEGKCNNKSFWVHVICVQSIIFQWTIYLSILALFRIVCALEFLRGRYSVVMKMWNEHLPESGKLGNVVHTRCRRCRRCRRSVVDREQLQICKDNASHPNDSLLQALPDEFLSNVLMWLSIRSLCKARIVCRRWNECIKSSEFQKLWIENPSSQSYYFSHYEGS